MDTSLPADLTDRGFRLIVRAPDRMFAVSQQWGCTPTVATVEQAVRLARRLIDYLEWRNRRQQIAVENDEET